MIESISKKITVKEFREMEFPDDDRLFYEVIDGCFHTRRTPTPLHQSISSNILMTLDNFLKEKKIGTLFIGPIDVIFDEYNCCQPDLIFIQKARKFIIDWEDAIYGAPDLIVEIISPSSIKIDRFDKKEMYKRFAVKEYWLIDPKNQTVEIYVFENNDYTLHQFLENEGKVDSTVMKGLDLDIMNMFL